MAVDTTRLEQALTEKEITGWYTWRPNQIYTKDPSNPNRYVSTDVMTDGALNEIIDAAQEAGDRQIANIQQAGLSKTTAINNQDISYSRIKTICLQTFRSMRTYFNAQGMGTIVASIDSAIRQINELP